MYQPMTLSYDYGALEPYISKKTLENHYNNHYLKYLDKLNAVLRNNNFTFTYPLTKLFDNISSFPINIRDDIIYNAGGVINHELYFNSFRPNGNLYIPELLANEIIRTFGSIDSFIEQFTSLANRLPGSGYTFLVLDTNRELYIKNFLKVADFTNANEKYIKTLQN